MVKNLKKSKPEVNILDQKLTYPSRFYSLLGLICILYGLFWKVNWLYLFRLILL